MQQTLQQIKDNLDKEGARFNTLIHSEEPSMNTVLRCKDRVKHQLSLLKNFGGGHSITAVKFYDPNAHKFGLVFFTDVSLSDATDRFLELHPMMGIVKIYNIEPLKIITPL
jgi:hypothetical protein